MNVKKIVGKVVELSMPMFVAVPDCPAAYEILVLRVEDEQDGQTRMVFVATNLQGGFEKAFTTLLFAKGKRVRLEVDDCCSSYFSGLGKEILNAELL